MDVRPISRSNSVSIQHAALNPKHHLVQEPRKRKRDINSTFDDPDWFEARILPLSQTQSLTNIQFTPITTVLRAHIPLAWLAGHPHKESIPPGTVFQSDIPAVSRWDYHVLVARHIPNGGLYAIERVQEKTYLCSPLNSFVSTECVQQASIGATPPVTLDDLISHTTTSHLRKLSTTSLGNSPTVLTTLESPKWPQNRRGMLARQSILAKDRPTEPAVSAHGHEGQVEGPANATQVESNDLARGNLRTLSMDENQTFPIAITHADAERPIQAAINDLNATSMALPEPVDQLSTEYLRKRYFEMLYLSKTSMAFYAKGPLSRTRARTRAQGASMTTEQLIDFYRDSILPAKKLDLKYRESLHHKIMLLTSKEDESKTDCDQDQTDRAPRKTKKTQKAKLGRDALWPVEDEFIHKWWMNRTPSGRGIASSQPVTSSTVTAEVKSAISQLRMREVELQIVLILEVLALEAKDAARSDTQLLQSSEVKIESVESDARDVLGVSVGSKKKRDLNSELETLLDKLCIWHSVGLDDVLLSKPSDPNGHLAVASSAKDRLREFCKDVVVPFYAGKLPQQSRTVCQKLGGPELSPQPPKPTLTTPAGRVAPGAAVSRDRPSAKRTLERVLSEDQSMRTASPPVLSRSSTVPMAPSQREPSERPASRSGLVKAISYTNREIDLVADAKATAAKRRKLELVAAQKRDLEAAIEALKKPNRHLVAGDLMDELEKRTTETKAAPRKIEPVQIIATPRKVRRARPSPAVIDDYDLPPMLATESPLDESHIPSSTSKARGLSYFPIMAKSSAKKRAVLSAIRDAPTTQPAPRFAADGAETNCVRGYATTCNQSSSTLVDSTPLRPRASLDGVACTPTRPDKARPLDLSGWSASLAPTTPTNGVPPHVPNIPEKANQMMERVMKARGAAVETSIYESLGWDDDYDL